MTIWRRKEKAGKQDTELPRFRFPFKASYRHQCRSHTTLNPARLFPFNTYSIEGVRCLLATAHVHMNGAARMGGLI
jgi:hypothetical protein